MLLHPLYTRHDGPTRTPGDPPPHLPQTHPRCHVLPALEGSSGPRIEQAALLHPHREASDRPRQRLVLPVLAVRVTLDDPRHGEVEHLLEPLTHRRWDFPETSGRRAAAATEDRACEHLCFRQRVAV